MSAPPHRLKHNLKSVVGGVARGAALLDDLLRDDERPRGTFDSQRAAIAGRWLDYQCQELMLPGLVLAICDHEGVLWRYEHGQASDQLPMTSQTPLPLASVSKLVTAILVIGEIERGRLSLDRPIGTVFKGLPRALQRVSARELLTHTAGLARDGDTNHFNDDHYPSAEQLRAYLRTSTPSAVGEMKYSNVGYALLGELLTASSGRSYEQLVAQRIAEPLRLSSLRPIGFDDVQASCGYDRLRSGQRQPLALHGAGGFLPAFGLVCDLDDLGRLTAAQLHRSKMLLSAEGWSLLYDSLPVGPKIAGRRRGLGYEVFDDGQLGHEGSLPGYQSAVRLLSDDGLAVVALANAIDAPLRALIDGLVGLLRYQPPPGAARLPSAADGIWTQRYGELLVGTLDGATVLANIWPASALALDGHLLAADGQRVLRGLGPYDYDGEAVVYEADEEHLRTGSAVLRRHSH